MNVDLVKELIFIAITSSIFSTGIIKKIKENDETNEEYKFKYICKKSG